MVAHPDLAGGRLTINLRVLVSNYHHLARLAGSAECAAVVKANAYGCGIEPAVQALAGVGCKTFYVALPEEGIRVKKVAPNARCFVLNGLFPKAAPHYQQHDLIPILGSLPEVEAWAHFCKTSGQPGKCALHFNSGMNRLGLKLNEMERVKTQGLFMDYIDPILIMTHYACADDVAHPKTNLQRERFIQACELFPGVPRSAANSAADLQADGHEFELVRPGIALYGGEALNDLANPMQPVVTLEGRIVQVIDVKKGESVGYGATETLKRDTRIAYLSVGYADGYHRAASNMGVGMRAVAPSAKAAFKGKVISGIGRISMDLSAFDVTDIPENEIGPGDWIELFGPTIPVDDVARAAGTIGYEMLTGLGSRYARTYLK